MEKDKLFNGLTYAEVMRGSLDILGNPDMEPYEHEVIVRTVGRFRDDIDVHKQQTTEFDEASLRFTQDEKLYEQLRTDYAATNNDTWTKPHRIGRAVLEGAGNHMHDIRRELYDTRDQWLADGEQLSRVMAGYIKEFLPESETVQLNGLTYHIDEGYLATREMKGKPADDKWLYTIFGSPETARQFSAKHNGSSEKNRKKFCKIAETKHWHKLLDDLRIAAMY